MNHCYTTIASTLLLCWAAGCAAETHGRAVRIAFAVEAEPDGERAPGDFETATGWQVSLERAELAIGAVYAFGPEEEPGVMARLGELVVPVAQAHGGHDPLSGKRVRAELLEPFVVDALRERDDRVEEVEAEAGTVASLAIDIAAPDAEVTRQLDGHQAFVAGTAARGDQTIRFAGGLTIPDDGLTRRIECTAGDLLLDDGATLVIGVRPHGWLRDAEFDRLSPAADDGIHEVSADSQVGRAWFIGVRSPAAYSVHTKEEK